MSASGEPGVWLSDSFGAAVGLTGAVKNLVMGIEGATRLNSGVGGAGGGRSGGSAPRLAKMQRNVAKTQEPKTRPPRRGLVERINMRLRFVLPV